MMRAAGRNRKIDDDEENGIMLTISTLHLAEAWFSELSPESGPVDKWGRDGQNLGSSIGAMSLWAESSGGGTRAETGATAVVLC